MFFECGIDLDMKYATMSNINNFLFTSILFHGTSLLARIRKTIKYLQNTYHTTLQNKGKQNTNNDPSFSSLISTCLLTQTKC